MKRGGALKHGMSKTPIYQVWAAMRDRCYRKTTVGWERYGGRGIKVCARWEESFANFYVDMAPTYKPGLWLDRKNNNGNYTPRNCVWSTIKTQSMNRRSTRWLKTPWGELPISHAAAKVGVTKVAMAYRVKYWPPASWFIPANPVKQRRSAMPSTSSKQKRTMAAIAHGWRPPKGSKVSKIPKKVAKEFNREDTKRGRRK